MPRKVIAMKHLLAIFLIGVSCFLFGYGGKEISLPQEPATQTAETAEAHYNLGLALENKDKEKAIAEFKKAIQLNPFYTEAHRKYMDLMREQGKKAEILEEYQAKVQQNPESEVYHYLLGRALDDGHDKFWAFQKAVEINPNYVWGHYGIGWVYSSQGMFDKAIASYQKAIVINPNHAEAHYNLGSAYRKQGKSDLAIESYQKAIAIEPDYAYAHYGLGNAYLAEGERDLAIESFKVAEGKYDLGISR